MAGRQTSRFGMRNGRMHEGLDMALKAGSPIYPAMPGVVLLAGELGSYGNVLVIEHGGSLATVYDHLQSISVAKGSRVGCEDNIGAVGSTGRAFGPHLHSEFSARIPHRCALCSCRRVGVGYCFQLNRNLFYARSTG